MFSMGKHSQLDAETNGASLAPFIQHTVRGIMSSTNSAILTNELGSPPTETQVIGGCGRTRTLFVNSYPSTP